MKPLAAVLAVACALACAACGGSAVTMSHVPPPTSWADDVAEDRAARDADFKNDPDSPLPRAARASFRGLTYFPIDPTWRYAGWIERYDPPAKLEVATTSGTPRPCERWGRVTFERDGRVLTLQVYRLLDMPERSGGLGLFLPFKDGTTGKDTYPAGRYVNLEGPDGGPFVLDFNQAYNPSCAYGEPERFQCPVTPAENTLSIAVPAGERGSARPAVTAKP